MWRRGLAAQTGEGKKELWREPKTASRGPVSREGAPPPQGRPGREAPLPLLPVGRTEAGS